MAAAETYFDQNSNALVFSNLRNSLTNAPIVPTDGLSFAASLTDVVAGTSVTAAISFTYVTSTKRWVGVIPADAPVTLGREYEAAVTIDGGTLERGVFYLRFIVTKRLVSG